MDRPASSSVIAGAQYRYEGRLGVLLDATLDLGVPYDLAALVARRVERAAEAAAAQRP